MDSQPVFPSSVTSEHGDPESKGILVHLEIEFLRSVVGVFATHCLNLTIIFGGALIFSS